MAVFDFRKILRKKNDKKNNFLMFDCHSMVKGWVGIGKNHVRVSVRTENYNVVISSE